MANALMRTRSPATLRSDECCVRGHANWADSEEGLTGLIPRYLFASFKR
jgi:hypothetical protein